MAEPRLMRKLLGCYRAWRDAGVPPLRSAWWGWSLSRLAAVMLATPALAAEPVDGLGVSRITDLPPALEYLELRPDRVSDGDTFRVGQLRYRLAAIDAPEHKGGDNRRGRRWEEQPHAAEAHRALAYLVAGPGHLTCLPIRMDGARPVVVCRLPDGRDLAEELVRQGAAWADPAWGGCRYMAAQVEAQAARRGLWAEDDPVEPWRWRNREAAEREACRTEIDA